MTEQSSPSSRNIPLPIQREVRRRCGFGCVICGMPLYEFEHMLGWAKVPRPVTEEITLMCDQHHRERTAGLLPIEAVSEANANPYNLRGEYQNPMTSISRGINAKLYSVRIPSPLSISACQHLPSL